MSHEAADHRPPSPPHSNDGDFGVSTSRMDHFQEPFTPPRTVRPSSHTELAYGAYSSPSHYPPVPQQIYYSPQPAFATPMHYHTPPHNAEPRLMTRSGRTLGSPIASEHQHVRSSQSPRPRKNKPKAGKRGAPLIDQPLSILTKDYKIPVRDMGAWVTRSVQERMSEVEKKKGYVSRPMNSFMLYRSAYAERVKQFCKENNHQVVSQVTGQSWPMEPTKVREMYEQYAITERDNHAAAHPTYKFAPNKNGRKRARDDEDDSDSDAEWRGSRAVKRSRPGTRDASRSMSSTPFDPERSGQFAVHMYNQSPQPHPSSYQAINPHGPPPFSFGPAGMSGGYYQSHAVPYLHHVDDVKFARMNDPFPPYNPASQLIGMPDSTGSELLGVSRGIGTNLHGDQPLDPQLAQFDQNYNFSHFDGLHEQSFDASREYGYGSFQPPGEGPHGGGEQVHPGMATLTEGWPEEDPAGTDFDNEFRKWS